MSFIFFATAESLFLDRRGLAAKVGPDGAASLPMIFERRCRADGNPRNPLREKLRAPKAQLALVFEKGGDVLFRLIEIHGGKSLFQPSAKPPGIERRF